MPTTVNQGTAFEPLDPDFFDLLRQGQTGGLTRGEGPIGETASRQRLLLGELGGLLPEGFVFRRSDVPLLETNLNLQNRQQALRDRGDAIGRLDADRLRVANSPEAILAREIAVARADSGGAFGPEVAERARGGLRSGLAVAGQDASQQLAEQLALRGLGGFLPAAELAGLSQALGVESARTLGDFGLQAAQLQDASERGALSDLQSILSEQGAREAAISQAIAEILLSDRGVIDLSGLLASPPGGAAPVGFFG